MPFALVKDFLDFCLERDKVLASGESGLVHLFEFLAVKFCFLVLVFTFGD